MKIQSIEISRFRGIKETAIFNLRNFNVIVGRNDKGKSTILKAINLFLNDVEPLPEIANAFQDDPIVEITIKFSLVKEKKIIIDEAIETTYEAEELTDTENNLVVKKVWDTSKSKIKADTFILRKKYIENDFILLTEKDLIKTCKSYEIETKKGNGEEFNNIEKRSKLREHYHDAGIEFSYEFEKLPTTGKTRAKLIHDSLKATFPRFEYFNADRPLNESDNAIQKYFKQLTKDILTENGADEIETIVKDGVEDVLSKITNKINEVLPEEQQVQPSVSFNWGNLVTTSFRSKKDDANIPLSFRGDGFRRLTMMAYFEYLAEEASKNHQNIIFGFEEPETFLHPKAQEELFVRLNGLADNNYQVLLTTHSSVIVSKAERQSLIHITNDGESYVVYQNIDDISNIIDDLGITPSNHFYKELEKAKAIVLVEGPDDVKAFNFVSEQYKASGDHPATLAEKDVVFVPIGGCDSVLHWHSLNILTDLGKPFYVIQDSDKSCVEEESANREVLKSLGLTEPDDFWVLRKRALENYISPSYFTRVNPDVVMDYDPFTHMKKYSKNHASAVFLGGKKIAEKHFCLQTVEEIKESFSLPDEGDEFTYIFKSIVAKL